MSIVECWYGSVRLVVQLWLVEWWKRWRVMRRRALELHRRTDLGNSATEPAGGPASHAARATPFGLSGDRLRT